jgi:hypothetical protein
MFSHLADSTGGWLFHLCQIYIYILKNQQRPFDDHTKEETSSEVFLGKCKQRAWALAPTPHIDFCIVGKHRNPYFRWHSKDSEAIWLWADFGRLWQFSTALDSFWQISAIFISLDWIGFGRFWQFSTGSNKLWQILLHLDMADRSFLGGLIT